MADRMTAFRLPAEWEPHAATWIAWPHRRATFLGPFEAIPPVYERLARLIARYEPVQIIGSREVLAVPRSSLADAANVAFVEIPTSDSWIRDTGPVFLVPRDASQSQRTRAVCWEWNAWGGKYPPWEADAGVSRAIAKHESLTSIEPRVVLEGDAMEHVLRKWLHVERVIWLGGDLAGDDTDGHIDQLARFVAPGRVLVARQPDRLDPNHESLEANLAILHAAADARGRRLEVIPIDIPARFAFEGAQLPASHLNFLVGNGFVVVPVFGAPTDESALRTIAGCFPGRTIEPFDCTVLVRGRGAIHCVTRDQIA
jgi:agmatine deiminase